MWKFKKDSSRDLVRAIGRYIVEKKAEELKIEIQHETKRATELLTRVNDPVIEDEAGVHLREKATQLSKEIEAKLTFFTEEINKIKQFRGLKYTEENICKKLDELRQAQEKEIAYFSELEDIIALVVGETEEWSVENSLKKLMDISVWFKNEGAPILTEPAMPSRILCNDEL